MALHDMGFIDFEEPFQRFRAHGMLILHGSKISKSRGNIVNPDDYFRSHGADTLRTYLMFAGRYEEGGDFSDEGIGGLYRFLNRVWDLVQRYRGQEGGDGAFPIEAQQVTHRTIKKVTHDISDLKFNTAIAALMEYSNQLQRRPALSEAEAGTLLLLLAPFAPFITEELWEQIGGAYSIHTTPWPQVNEALAQQREVAVAVQIDGRTRDVIQVEAGSDEESVVQRARQSPRVQRHLDGKVVVRTIYVADRLLNFVTAARD
jgi:leucyl-tRNA synthetase